MAEYDGWAAKIGKRIVAGSFRQMSEKEVVTWISQYASHAGKLIGSYKVVKVKLVEAK